MIVNSAVPVCSLSVCICTQNFWKKNHLQIRCFPSACTQHFTHNDPGRWNPDHKVCIVAVFSTNVHTHAYMLHRFTHIAGMQTHSINTDIQYNVHAYGSYTHMHKHILQPPDRRTQTPERSHKHKHTYSPFSLCVFHRFLCHLVRVRDSDCSSCSQQTGVGGDTHYYVWHHLCFH